MNDEFVAGKILDILRTEKYCNVAAKDFLQLWFNQTNGLNERMFTEKLLNFSKDNRMDYLIKMAGDGRGYDSIIFWRTEKKENIELLEEGNGQSRNVGSKEEDGEGHTTVSG